MVELLLWLLGMLLVLWIINTVIPYLKLPDPIKPIALAVVSFIFLVVIIRRIAAMGWIPW